MRETWYVLEDGSAVSPSKVAPDDTGVLRHQSGAVVAMRGQVPSTRSVDPDEERSKRALSKPKAKDLKPEEKKGGYKTRESKAD